MKMKTLKFFVSQCFLLQSREEFFTWCMLTRVPKGWLLLALICLTFFVHESGSLAKFKRQLEYESSGSDGGG